jgi:hypothetical protein
MAGTNKGRIGFILEIKGSVHPATELRHIAQISGTVCSMEAILRRLPTKQNLCFVMVTITSSNSCSPCRRIHTQSKPEKTDEDLCLRSFDLIRDARFA